jgi:exodeoxyribonuclease VII large subunit
VGTVHGVQDALFGDDAVVEPTWSVADLSRAAGDILERAFPGEVWVRGEIRGIPPPGDPRRAKPHLYFDLVEPGPPGGQPAAVLPVVLWSTDRRRVNADLRRSGVRVSVIDAGVDVRIRGRVRWWGPRARAQLQMTGIDPEYTLGRLAADRAAVLARLEAEGLLERNRGLSLPVLPERVGLVTSVGSAAHADVHRVLSSAGLAHLVVEADARTQGADALHTIPRALAAVVEAGAEVVLLVRGGGSRVELACFDSFEVAAAVAACPVPVVAGIGHEIDESVADRVAHTAAPTPTAAAAAIVARVAEARDRVRSLWTAIATRSEHALDRHERALGATARHAAGVAGAAVRAGGVQLTAAEGRLRRGAPAALAGAARRVERAADGIARDARRDVTASSRAVDAAAATLARRAVPAVVRRGRDLDAVDARVRAVDPALALARGWSITYGPDGSVVRDPAALADGDVLRTVLARGEVRSRVAAEGGAPGDGAGPGPDATGSTDG